MTPSTNEFRKVVHELIAASPDVIELKVDVAVLKSDVAVLKSDVAVLKSDVAVLKADVSRNTIDLHHFGLVQDQMQRDIKLILDAVITLQRSDERRNALAGTVDQHELRLTVVETSVKDHLRDKDLHNS